MSILHPCDITQTAQTALIYIAYTPPQHLHNTKYQYNVYCIIVPERHRYCSSNLAAVHSWVLYEPCKYKMKRFERFKGSFVDCWTRAVLHRCVSRNEGKRRWQRWRPAGTSDSCWATRMCKETRSVVVVLFLNSIPMFRSKEVSYITGCRWNTGGITMSLKIKLKNISIAIVFTFLGQDLYYIRYWNQYRCER
jgi:hypothetical protein